MGFESSYFFDNMDFQELNLILSNYDYRFRTELETTRTLAYITAQCNSSKKLKPEDIIQYRWDKKEEKPKPIIHKMDVETMKNNAERLAMKLNTKTTDGK